MAPSKTTKFVQPTILDAFRKVTKGRVEKPKVAQASTLSKLDDSAKEKAVEAAAANPTLQDVREEIVEAEEKAVETATANLAQQDGREEIVGVGSYQTVCHVKTVDADSDTLFNGPVKQVKKTMEAADEHRRLALDYQVIKDSTVVRTKDGRPLLYFLKKGIFAGMSADEQQQLGQQSMGAVRRLIDNYTPPAPPTEDPRVKEKGAQKMKEWAEKGKAYGRYVSFHQKWLVIFS